MSHFPRHIYAFGPYRLDSGERLLSRDGLPIALQPKAFDLLLTLVERHGHLLTKDELLRVVWPDSVVEEVNLANNVSILRRTLGEGEQQFIETVPRHGYRFVASVKEEIEKEVSAAEEIETTEPRLAETARPVQVVSRWKRRPALAVALLALLCTGLAGVSISRLSDRQPVTPNVTARSIAVLPFKPIAARERDELLELGMADALITKLSGAGQLVVRPTGAVRQYASDKPDPLAAGRDLRVEFVLDGSLLKSGDRVRVTARLLRVADGTAVWATTLEEKQTDLFRIQDSISQKIAESLSLKLTSEQRTRLASRSIRNTEAFRLYVQGRYFAQQDTTEGFRKGVELLTRAIESAPDYAPAYVALSEAWQAASVWLLPPTEGMPKAKAAVEQALRLDDQLPEAHVMLGWVKWSYEWDWSGAERDFRRAIELDPTRVELHHSYAWFLSSFPERHNEALAELQLVNELDPSRLRGAAILYNTRRYEQAIELCRLTISPNIPARLQWLGLAYVGKQMYQEAITAFQQARQLDDSPDMRAYVGHAWARSGERVKSVRMLDELKRLSHERYVSPFFIALIHLGLDENDQAFEWLEQAYRERACWLIGLRNDPRFDHLRADPRFTDLLRRVGLTP
jgi:DNA-binding winged helix-turn-helix (wHTH) protein/TolB-like protein/cytochrome c-type biogenesis protein CcmH/NrfG